MTINNIETRIAGSSDAQFISLLGRVTFTETFGHLYRDRNDLSDYYDRTFSVSKIENSLAKPTNIFWISFADRLPVAYAKLKLDSESEFVTTGRVCQLQKIYVLKDFLSMKIGYELQNRLLQKAIELSYDKIWLSVLQTNDRATRFYTSAGFKTVGTHNYRIGKENFEFYVMSKALDRDKEE